jgi:ribonuclease D
LTAEVSVAHKKPEVFDWDLPRERLEHYLSKPVIAVDTETRGLILRRDRLCLVQICDEEGVVSFVRYSDRLELNGKSPENLKKLLESDKVIKLFHFARFDIGVMKYNLNIDTKPIFCTKLGSKLVRTYTDKHGLKDLVKDLLGVELDKSDQMSDWARTDLSDTQLEYAANDVRVLIPIYKKLQVMLEREGRTELADRVIKALHVVSELDVLGGWRDIFEH